MSPLKNKHIAVRFTILKSNHLLLRVKLNNVWGNFILDTGASNTCLAASDIEKFALQTNGSSQKAASASHSNIETLDSHENILKIGTLQLPSTALLVMDLENVKIALRTITKQEINGILGADILLQNNAIIHYEEKKVYFQKNK